MNKLRPNLNHPKTPPPKTLNAPILSLELQEIHPNHLTTTHRLASSLPSPQKLSASQLCADSGYPQAIPLSRLRYTEELVVIEEW
ncbi:hypothetical protein LENED_001939 [Lentinula edodes]|uniref:Uncharacterized protein n=1 Tax=Lentinula edodes TaxID=5353 RepID=A0A1Q3DZK3_LENED|nr:hypothetical protein LENED_001939 [Lentinula edodes]